MAGLTEFYCRLNEISHASQFKWLDNTFNTLIFPITNELWQVWNPCFLLAGEINVISEHNQCSSNIKHKTYTFLPSTLVIR
jgi:hypothetical protein